MKRYLALGAGILVLAFAGWSLAWWLGRGEVERMIDESMTRLHEQGWLVETERREVTGFPFSYGVRFRNLTISDTESGLVVHFPSATASAAGSRRTLVQLPERFRLEFPVPALARAADPDIGDMVSLNGAADGLVLVLMQDETSELTADRLVLRWQDDVAERRVIHSLAGVEATSLVDTPGRRYRLHAREATIETDLPGADGRTKALASLNNVNLQAAANLRSGTALTELLYAGVEWEAEEQTEEQAEGTLAIGAAKLEISTEGASPGKLEWQAEALSAGARVTSGRIELDFEARGNDWTLTSPDPEMPLQGKFSMELARAHYAMPMAPSADPKPMTIALILDRGMAGESIWDSLDPKGVLPRAPASLRMGLSGTARVTTRIDQLLPGDEPPFEISTINLDEVAVDALGAKLNAAGELELIQPFGRPLGEVRIGMTGLSTLVDALGKAELISPDMLVTARAIMQVYLREASGDDAWTAVVDFTSGGTEVNGLKVR